VLQGKQQVLYPPHNKVTTHVFRGEPNMNQVKPVLLVKRDLDIPTWVQALNQQMPALEVRIWPELGDPSEIEFALLWMPPPELFTELSNLEVIFSVGAGIDHLLACPSLPRNIPIVRMVEPGLTSGMVEYVLYNVLRFHRGMDRYDAQQRAAHWSVLPQISAEARSIGIMGLGMIGQAVAELLVTMGFKVHGWSQTRKVLPGVNSYVGEAERNAFLQNTEILVREKETDPQLYSHNLDPPPVGAPGSAGWAAGVPCALCERTPPGSNPNHCHRLGSPPAENRGCKTRGSWAAPDEIGRASCRERV
jgi:hypothetical protein